MHRPFPFRLLWQWCCFALLLLPAKGRAQGPEALNHQAWSTEEGLPDASVHSLLQARDGYLWFGTEGGAVRFDGYSFVVFRHANEPAFTSDDVSAVAEDSHGTLWLGTADGLVCREGETFRRFNEANGLPSARILGLAADSRGKLLVLTGKGLAFGNAQGFQVLPGPQVQVTALLHDVGGDIWIATAGGATLPFREGQLLRQDQLPFATAPAELALPSGPSATLWSAGARGVVLQTPHGQRVLDIGHGLPRGRVQALLADAQGRTWIGTSRGLLVFTRPAGTVEPVAALRDESILSLLQDREGNLWVGTEASGLQVLRRRKFRAVEGTLGEPVTAVVVTADGTPWIGTRDRGLRMVHGGEAEEVVEAARLTSPVVLSLARSPQGVLWAGTPDGLNRISASGVSHLTAADGLPDDFVRSLQVDARGVLWAGTRRGLARVTQEGKIRVLTAANGLGSDSVGALRLPSSPEAGKQGKRQGEHPQKGQSGSMEEDQDELWIGTSGGLSHLVGAKAENFALPGAAVGSIVTALADAGVHGLLVAFHERGLFVFRNGAFHAVNSDLLPREITALQPDRQGFLWMRNATGLYRVRLDAVERCAESEAACRLAVSSFSSADGLPSEGAFTEGVPGLALGPDGRLWIATRKGLAVADPGYFPVNTAPPPVSIQSFTVDGVAMPLSRKDVQVGPGHSRYTFVFAALSYTMQSRVHYRTFLQGFDHDWISNGNGRSASYTSLPPRHYRFQVQAQNNDGVWSREIAAVEFDVRPPLYQRWYFYLCLALLAALVIFAAIRLRERTVQRRFSLVLEERNRLAREIHDTLAQDFVSLSLQLEIASSLLKQQQVEKAAAQLTGMRQAIREGLQAARQSIWDLRASAGEESLPARLTVLVSRYAISGKPPRLSIGGAFRTLPRSMEAEVLRIAQESLANIERHAGATEASVDLQYGPNELLLTIKDNGRGFSSEAAKVLTGHYGLRGMQERAAALRGKLQVSSLPGQGTTVLLQVPLAEKEVA